MRRRDVHMVVAECVLTCIALAACALSVFVAWKADRRVARRVDELSKRIDVAERTVADAAAAAMAACDVVREPVSANSDEAASIPVRVLGYGQGRTRRRRYIYRDTELLDGSVDRAYIAWFPLGSEGGEGAP